MTQTQKAWWKAGLTVVMVTLVAAALRLLVHPLDVERPPWLLLLGLASIALVGYLVQGVALALMAGVLIGIHPRIFEDPLLGYNVRLADSCSLVACAFVLLAWRQAQERSFVWWKWLLLFAGLSCSVGFAWRLERLAGLEAAIGVFAMLGLIAPLTRVFGAFRTGWPNLVVMTALGLLVPVAAFGVAQDFTTFQPDYWQEPDWPTVAHAWQSGLEGTFLVHWCISEPVILWGWWRTLRRGWRQQSRGEAPAVWTVSCFSLLAGLVPFFAPAPSRALPTIMVWGIFLVIFLVFDILQAVGERLVLQPPDPQKGTA